MRWSKNSSSVVTWCRPAKHYLCVVGAAGAVAISQLVIVANASAWLSPHISALGCKPIQVAGRPGRPNKLQACTMFKCGQRTPAALPCGSAGSDGEIEGAIQHAPHSARQVTSKLSDTNFFTKHKNAARQTRCAILVNGASIGAFHALPARSVNAQRTFALVFARTGRAHQPGAARASHTPRIGGTNFGKTFFRRWAVVISEAGNA